MDYSDWFPWLEAVVEEAGVGGAERRLMSSIYFLALSQPGHCGMFTSLTKGSSSYLNAFSCASLNSRSGSLHVSL